MAIEDTLISIDSTLKQLLVIAQSGTAGAALVGASGGTPADDTKVKKATHFHLVDKKQVVKVEAGGERPLGGLEVTAAEAKKLTEKYTADGAAKNDQSSPTGAAGAQSQGTSGASSSTTGTPSGSQSSEGPSFQDVTAKITEMSKMPEVGRAKVVEILKLWGVEKFPQVQGKKPNADLIADIVKLMAPAPKEEPASEFSDLGL